MCTVVFDWKPNSKSPLIVGANRDEHLNRPSTGFEFRGSIFLCPRDVGGGTWIGVNSAGVFAAITNRNDGVHQPNKSSRGKLVWKILEDFSNAKEALDTIKQYNPEDYNGFRLIAIDQNYAGILSCDSQALSLLNCEPGLHTVTGFGIDTWDIPRCQFIQNNYHKENLRTVLSYHGDGTVETAVCVHDKKESHQTRSSCIIVADENWHFQVEEYTTAPCQKDKIKGFVL